MKKMIFIMIMITFCFLSFGNEKRSLNYELSELYYSQDIISTGIDHSYDFFFPIVYSEQIQESAFTIFYEMTQISGPKTMYVLMVNGTPVQTGYLETNKGQMTIPFSSELFGSEALLRISLYITLDYPVCDQSRVNQNALWFRLKKNSYLTYSYVEKEIETIPVFLSSTNPNRHYELISDGTFNQLEAYLSLAQYMGYLSKGIKRSFTISPTSTALNNRIEINEDSTSFVLNEGTLSLPADFTEWGALNYINTVPASEIMVSYNETKQTELQKLSFSQLGINTFRTDVVFSNRLSFPIVLDAFGGVPDNSYLDLNFSVFNRLRKDGFLLNVFINDYLLQSVDLSNYSFDERGLVNISIPSNYFSAYNTLTFEVLNQKSDCDEFSLIIYDDSTISFKDSKPYVDPYVNEFPYSIYGKTLYVVSEYSMRTAQNLINLAFEKGRVSTSYSSPQITSLSEFYKIDLEKVRYDSLVFFINSKDFYPLTEFIDLNDSFNILNDKNEILFKATTNDQFDVVYSFNYQTLPAVVFSGYNHSDVLINDAFFRKMSKAVSEFALLSESQVFSFETGKSLFTVESEKTEELNQSSFWMKNRLWIVVLAVVIILFILLSSYNKTSKGR